MKRFFSFLFIACFFISLQSAHAQDNTQWSVKDVINQERASSLQFSPDGNSVVWAKRYPDREKDRFVYDLYLTRLDVTEDGKPKTVHLTRGSDSDYNPLFSRDGETIYFLSSRDKGNTLWAMSIYGGEPYKVYTFDTGISDPQWMGDDLLAFESEEGKTLYEKELEEAEDNTVVVEDTAHFKPSRVYSFNLKTKDITRLTDNRYPIGEFAASSDGKYLVTSHIRSPGYGADANPKSTYYLWNLEEDNKQQILAEGYQTPGNFTFREDNKGFYFVSVQSSDPQWNGAGITLLHHYNLKENAPEQIPLDWDWGLGSGFDISGNAVFAGLANGTTVKPIYIEPYNNGWRKREVQVNGSVRLSSFSVLDVNYKEDKVAFVTSDASTPPKYYAAELGHNRTTAVIKDARELFEINTHLKDKTKAKTEVVTWTGAMDDEITGILYYPHDYQEGRSYPLVVTIHGGPSGVDTDSWGESWTDFNNIMNQKGAFVLMPNYHGSSNHGQEFVESIKGHYYEYELPDIVAGVEMLVDQGKVDPDSMGVKGWSNGAILTTMLTVQYPDMFKVAAPGAGDVNWSSDYGTCAFGVQFDQSYFGGAPWDNTDGKIYNTAYIQKSPLFEMEKVRTPTIIFHGSEDRAVPRDQGWEYYRALEQIGEAPVRFLWFPDQPHGLQKITHQTRKMEEEIKWFDRYLFGTYEAENEAFKEDSPLAELLKKEKASKVDGYYGIAQNDVLLPEMVLIAKDSISISRFELTNAQYAAYADKAAIEQQGNYPVTGLTMEDISGYITWLNEQTGETYRLPTEEEAKRLHKLAKKSAKNENTLNYWAGYDITLDEVDEFRQKMEGLNRSLLKEAGSFSAVKVGSAYIYDLGGNAAEISAEGNIYGYSAVSFVDDRGDVSRPAAAYIGFRLVKDN
ncbi:MAG: prolyl oligopeptidase family serine peptidase [Balneolaceae bacterium]|nr:prolyl oligopeptidase family serine peptidase [Balneolaceae bacterium]